VLKSVIVNIFYTMACNRVICNREHFLYYGL